MLSLLKITSIHDLLKFSNEYRLIIETITQIVPLLGDLFIQVLLLVLFYGVIGVHFFGGLVSNAVKNNYKEVMGDSLGENYEYLTLNDIPSALLTLYSIMITNDWSKIMTHCILEVKGSTNVFWARAFFLSFFGLGFMLVLNTTIGAIIDFINTYLSILQENENSTANKEQEGTNVMKIGSDLLGVFKADEDPGNVKKKKKSEIFQDEELEKKGRTMTVSIQ
jgi:hypothetical protein